MREPHEPRSTSRSPRFRMLAAALPILAAFAATWLLTREPTLSRLPADLREPAADLGWMLAPLGLLVGFLVAGTVGLVRDWPRGGALDPAGVQSLILIETRASRMALIGAAAGIGLALASGLAGADDSGVQIARYACSGTAAGYAGIGLTMILAAEVRIVEQRRDDAGGEEMDVII